MNKTIKASALLVAGLFAVSGCGSSEGKAESVSAESSSPSSTPTPTLAVGQDQYSADDLEDALMAVRADQNLSGQIANDATLRPEMAGAADDLAGVTITPAQCNVLASTNIDKVLDNAHIAVLMLSETDTLTLVSHADASVLEKQVKENASLLGECAEFKMEAAGQVLTAVSEELDAATEAETTQAFETIVSGEGMPGASIIQVAGASGTTNVSINISDATDADAAVAEAEKLIDAVLAELEAK